MSEGGVRGAFAGRGVTGKFAIVVGEVAVTIDEKPFWLPEMLLKHKITEGLEKLCDELACSSS